MSLLSHERVACFGLLSFRAIGAPYFLNTKPQNPETETPLARGARFFYVIPLLYSLRGMTECLRVLPFFLILEL